MEEERSIEQHGCFTCCAWAIIREQRLKCVKGQGVHTYAVIEEHSGEGAGGGGEVNESALNDQSG